MILFLIGGAWYFMADIGLRMLTPRELYRANGFPDDYKIDKDYTGKEYGKTKQVARCGNAVPRPWFGQTCRNGAEQQSRPWHSWSGWWPCNGKGGKA